MDPVAEIDVVILGAVQQEIGPLTEYLESCRVLPFSGETIWLGKYSNLSVLIATTGLGKVNAAITAASLLERFSARLVWNVGCAGAYPDGPLKIGDVLITDKTHCGDEGVITQKGALPVSEIGIPIVVRDGQEFYDHLPSHWNEDLETIIKKTPPGLYRQTGSPPLTRAYADARRDRPALLRSGSKDGTTTEPKLPRGHSAPEGETDEDLFQLIYGPSLTIGMASGDPKVARERFRRYGAYAENMEGSAVAQACCRFDTPMAECRGISNIAGVRSKESWQLEKSIAHCHSIVINWLETLKSLSIPLP
jgi:futalosine hydrolase